MKNVLGIIGSTRKMGNSELAVKMISHQIPESHSLTLIRLSDLEIKPCLGCYKCIIKDGKCTHDDDMEIFLNAFEKADGVIISVPVYLFGPNGTIKMLVDRCCMMYPRFERYSGKPCLIVVTLGVPGKDGYSAAALGSAAMTMGLEIMGEANYLAAGLGEILSHEENFRLAKEMGGALFSSKKEIVRDGKRCQVCGSQSFKFIEGGVECLVCQNQGEMIARDGKAGIRIEKSEISELNTIEDRRHHLQWVKGKKAAYSNNREELKKMSIEYAGHGTWIKGRKENKIS